MQQLSTQMCKFEFGSCLSSVRVEIVTHNGMASVRNSEDMAEIYGKWILELAA